ncbi:Hypothetical_protein [Hexamita inflata]|uniref:Hypothetical_protein n=1 Tax=Hexamita inflata TaxID=28002 RepID=A0AA86Q7D2_9EUKA|nr:Hypothetical protein HINF_LOCUS34885 [Hexamita inflata]
MHQFQYLLYRLQLKKSTLINIQCMIFGQGVPARGSHIRLLNSLVQLLVRLHITLFLLQHKYRIQNYSIPKIYHFIQCKFQPGRIDIDEFIASNYRNNCVNVFQDIYIAIKARSQLISCTNQQHRRKNKQ